LSGLLDGWDRFTAWVWDGLVDAGGAVGDFFNDLLDLTGLAEGIAVLRAMAESASGTTAEFINEQLEVLGGLVNQGIEAAAETGEQLANAGGDAVEAVDDFLDDTGEFIGDAAEGVFDLFGSVVGD
jgi:hypothetical protein